MWAEALLGGLGGVADGVTDIYAKKDAEKKLAAATALKEQENRKKMQADILKAIIVQSLKPKSKGINLGAFADTDYADLVPEGLLSGGTPGSVGAKSTSQSNPVKVGGNNSVFKNPTSSTPPAQKKATYRYNSATGKVEPL